MASGTTSVWGRPYPLETDSPDVAADIESLANSLDIWPLYPTTAASSRTGVIGESALCSAGVTYTLPASPTKGQALRAVAGPTTTGASPVTVATSGGKVVNGLGLSSASSFVLGIPYAHTTIQFDGTNWQIIDGEQDTGWVALTLGTNITAATNRYVPSARLHGTRVDLCGSVINSTGGVVTTGSTFATLPSVMAPAKIIDSLATFVGASGSNLAFVGIPIAASTSLVYEGSGGASWASSAALALDNLGFRVL